MRINLFPLVANRLRIPSRLRCNARHAWTKARMIPQMENAALLDDGVGRWHHPMDPEPDAPAMSSRAIERVAYRNPDLVGVTCAAVLVKLPHLRVGQA